MIQNNQKKKLNEKLNKMTVQWNIITPNSLIRFLRIIFHNFQCDILQKG